MGMFLRSDLLGSNKKWVSVSSGVSGAVLPSVPQTIKITVLSSNEESTLIKYQVFGFNTKQVKIDGKNYNQISVPKVSSVRKKGFPELPRLSRNIIVPVFSEPSFKIVSLKKKQLEIGLVAPSKGHLTRDINPAQVPYVLDEFYNFGEVFPEASFKLSKVFRLRSVSGVNLSFFPLRYDSSTNVLQVITEMVVKISTPIGRGHSLNLFSPNIQDNYDFRNLYQRQFLNYHQMTNSLKRILPEHFVGDQGKVLVISHVDFVETLKPYIDWKRQKGLGVKVVTLEDTGSTYEEIKSYIQNQYDQNGISYVVLVGDAEFVPYHKGKSGNAYGNEADPMYGLVEGEDSYPDLFISRISIKNQEELGTVVAKILNYEKQPDIEGTWYSKATGIASDEGTPSDGERAEILREKLESWHYTEIDKLYDPGVTAAQVSQVVNEGRGLINYIGHGSKTSWGTSGFGNSHINKLENGNKLPLIVSVACVNGDFGSGSDAFAEKWIKVGTAQQSRGAIAIFASSTNQSWVPPTVGQKEIADLMITEQTNTVGGLFFNGVIAVLEDNSSSAVQTFETWHIFGDATLQVRTKTPTMINALLPSNYFVGNTEIKVQVGEEGIKLGVLQGEEQIGSGISDAEGNIVIPLDKPLSKPDMALFTFTGFNKVPLIKEVPVLEPVKVSFSPENRTIDESVSGTWVEISMLDPEGIPVEGAMVWAEGFQYKGNIAYTDDQGKTKVYFQYNYGPSLQIKARRETEKWLLMDHQYSITNTDTFQGNLVLKTEVDLQGKFAVGFPGTVIYDEPIENVSLYLQINKDQWTISEGTSLTYTPEVVGNYDVYMVKTGFDVYKTSFLAINAKGNLNIKVVDLENNVVSGAKVVISGPESHEGTVSDQGKVAFANLSIGDYKITASKFSYQDVTVEKQTLYGENEIIVQMLPARRYLLSGRITLEEAPVTGTLKVFKDGEAIAYETVTADDEGYYEVLLPVYQYSLRFSFRGAKRKLFDILIEDDNPFDVDLEKSSGVLILQLAGVNRMIFKELLDSKGIETRIETFKDTDPDSWFDYTGIIVAVGGANKTLPKDKKLINFVNEGGKVFAEGGEVAYHYRYKKTFLEKVLLSSKFKNEKVDSLVFPEGGPLSIEMTIELPLTWKASDTFLPVDGAYTLATANNHADEAVAAMNGSGLFMSLDAGQIPNNDGQRDVLLSQLLDLWLKSK